jgi:hypothetical protein
MKDLAQFPQIFAVTSAKARLQRRRILYKRLVSLEINNTHTLLVFFPVSETGILHNAHRSKANNEPA